MIPVTRIPRPCRRPAQPCRRVLAPRDPRRRRHPPANRSMPQRITSSPLASSHVSHTTARVSDACEAANAAAEVRRASKPEVCAGSEGVKKRYGGRRIRRWYPVVCADGKPVPAEICPPHRRSAATAFAAKAPQIPRHPRLSVSRAAATPTLHADTLRLAETRRFTLPRPFLPIPAGSPPPSARRRAGCAAPRPRHARAGCCA